MVISMLKIRRPLGRLIFNMGIAIPGKTVFLLRRPPGPLLNIKTISPSIGIPTVWRPSHHYNGNSYTVETIRLDSHKQSLLTTYNVIVVHIWGKFHHIMTASHCTKKGIAACHRHVKLYVRFTVDWVYFHKTIAVATSTVLFYWHA